MRQRTALIVGLVALGLVQLLARQQPADSSSPPTAAITGVVIDGATKQSIAGALVSLSVPGANAQPEPQLTDARGRFVFLHLAAAPNYTLTADRLGYAPTPYSHQGKPGAGATPVALREGEWLSDLQVALWRRAAVTGVVTDERGEPVADVFVRAIALVRLHGQDHLAAGPLTTTDDRGVYRLPDLNPGRHLIHVPTVHGTLPSGSMPAGVTAAGAALAGSSVDIGGGARLVMNLNQYPTPPPPVEGRPRAYAMTFHPAARTLANAEVVSIGVGEERTADVRIEPVEVFRVSGRVDGPAEALTALTLRLVPGGLEALGLGSETATALVAPDGTFTFANVPSGAYTIDAPRVLSELSTNRIMSSRTMLPRPPGRGGWSSTAQPIEMVDGTSLNTLNYRGIPPNYWGRTSVAVDSSDRTGVVVTMRVGGTMHGRIVAEPGDQAGSAEPSAVSVYLEPATSEFGPAMLQADRTGPPPPEFAIQGLLATPYWLRARGTGWVVRSVLWKGRDYADVPFDGAAGEITDVVVTVTRAAPIVTGLARDAAGNVVGGATVLAFPADRRLRSTDTLSPARVRTAVTASNGVYRLATLPAGDYLLVAIDSVGSLGLPSPDFLQAAERLAVRQSLAWGQTRTVDLTMSEIR